MSSNNDDCSPLSPVTPFSPNTQSFTKSKFAPLNYANGKCEMQVFEVEYEGIEAITSSVAKDGLNLETKEYSQNKYQDLFSPTTIEEANNKDLESIFQNFDIKKQ
jgi:hypothetical protein